MANRNQDLVVKDIERMEKQIEYVNQTVIPDIYKRLNTIDTKVAGMLVLWGFNIVLLSIIIRQVFK